MEKKFAVAIAVLVFTLSLAPSVVNFTSGRDIWSAPITSTWKVGDTWFYDGAPLTPVCVLPNLSGISAQRGIAELRGPVEP